MPARWILGVFEALAAIYVVFSSHGRGLLPPNLQEALEKDYEKYRENYNSSLTQWLRMKTI